MRSLKRNTPAIVAGLVFFIIAVLALFANWLPLDNPDLTDPVNRLKRPFSEHALLGTDHLGRDMLSRLLHGTGLSLLVGFTAAFFAALIGSAIGIIAGYSGGRIDNWLMRSIDMLMAFPYILIALAIVAALGPGLFNALIAVAIVNVPFFARNMRGVTRTLAHSEFVDAARLNGLGTARIVFSEILPNVMPYIVVTLATTVGWMIVETAGLSFLGLGSQPPQADLGSMLGEGRKLLINAPHVSIIPGLMIFCLVICINLLGDGIRDALDPRMRQGAMTRPAARTQVATDRGITQSSANAMLEISGLRAEFVDFEHSVHALNGVDLSLARGESLGLIGESGSGKSVTALSIASLLPSPPGLITDGAVHYEGQELLALEQAALRRLRGNRIAYVFQDPMMSLHPLHRIGDQIKEALKVHQMISDHEARSRVIELLTQVRIPNPDAHLSSYPHELSGGMRQRIAIAMALANNPDLLVADEPTTALDVTIQSEILTLLAELRQRQGLSLLFISHDIAVVSQLCQRIAVMYGGQIVEIGETADVIRSPAHPYTRALIDCLPENARFDQKLPVIPGMQPALHSRPQSCVFAERCTRVSSACRETAVDVVSIETTSGERKVKCLHPLTNRSTA